MSSETGKTGSLLRTLVEKLIHNGQHHPIIKKLELWDGSIMNRARLYYYYLRWSRESVADPNEVHYISPDDVSYSVSTRRMKGYLMGNEDTSPPDFAILNGDWDERKFRLEMYAFYTAAINHFEYGVPWEETRDYQQRTDRYEDEQELKNIFNSYDELYYDIKNNGYDYSYPVTLLIGRNGEYIRWNGLHRVTISQLLGVDTIPAVIKFRHEKWQDIRHEYALAGKDNDSLSPKGNIQKYREHPDLETFE